MACPYETKDMGGEALTAHNMYIVPECRNAATAILALALQVVHLQTEQAAKQQTADHCGSKI